MKQTNAPMPSLWAWRALSMASSSLGWSSVIWSTQSVCTSRSHDQRSWKDAPAARLSGVAWKSRLLLNGGSVAIRSTDSEFIARRTGRLSQWKSVRFFQFGSPTGGTIPDRLLGCQVSGIIPQTWRPAFGFRSRRASSPRQPVVRYSIRRSIASTPPGIASVCASIAPAKRQVRRASRLASSARSHRPGAGRRFPSVAAAVSGTPSGYVSGHATPSSQPTSDTSRPRTDGAVGPEGVRCARALLWLSEESGRYPKMSRFALYGQNAARPDPQRPGFPAAA